MENIVLNYSKIIGICLPNHPKGLNYSKTIGIYLPNHPKGSIFHTFKVIETLDPILCYLFIYCYDVFEYHNTKLSHPLIISSISSWQNYNIFKI